MNALINALINRKNVVLANEGRLLKKSFFGLPRLKKLPSSTFHLVLFSELVIANVFSYFF